MPKLILLDLETTGLDQRTCRPIQCCVTVWDTDTGETVSKGELLYDPATYPPITKEITEITGIKEEQLNFAGIRPADFFRTLAETIARMDFVVAHNGASFDRPVLFAECARHGITPPKTPWIDSRTDIPYPATVKCRILSHLAFEHGIPVHLHRRHDAAYDVELMLEILKKYNIVEIIATQASPWMVVKAFVSYDDKEKAKAKRFSWEKIDGITFTKSWVKKVRQCDIEKESKEWDFKWEAKPLENYQNA